MTIQRLYDLPNCKLVLEGYSADTRPILSALMSAECHFKGKGQPLTGGREFFESLVRAVSSYAQEFLSGVSSPLNRSGKSGLVEIRKIHGDLHRLSFEEPMETARETQENVASGRSIDLTAVQLFDLVEAVDQFFADPLTLPDLALDLRPVSKRDVTSREPVAKRALPAAIGTSGLALAAIAFFFLPIPEVRRPVEPVLEREGSGLDVEPSPISTPEEPIIEPSPSPSPEDTSKLSSPETIFTANLEESLATTPTPKITDSDKIEELGQELYAAIDENWRQPLSTNLTYRVEVAEDGAIVGYKPINPEAADDVGRTPLPELLYKPVSDRNEKEPIVEFKLELKSDNSLQVSPW